MGQPLRRR